jgi:hypothetical protein
MACSCLIALALCLQSAAADTAGEAPAATAPATHIDPAADTVEEEVVWDDEGEEATAPVEGDEQEVVWDDEGEEAAAPVEDAEEEVDWESESPAEAPAEQAPVATDIVMGAAAARLVPRAHRLARALAPAPRRGEEMRSPATLCAVLVLTTLALLWSPPAAAVKYMSLKQAVTKFTPKGTKVVKVTKTLTAEQKARLKADYGWSPDKDSYTFYVGKDAAGEAKVYVVVVPELINTCFHKYAVGMTPDGEVIETLIVELSCPRAFPIKRKTFLKQFSHKTHADALTIRADIDGVTGATLSSEATAQATRKAVSLHNLIFGGGQAVTVSDDVKEARTAGSALIKKAIESGETLSEEDKAKRKQGS